MGEKIKMEKGKLLMCLLLAIGAFALHVTVHVDGITIERNSFFSLGNFNDVSSLAHKDTQMTQQLTIDLTSTYENMEFDILIFESEESSDYKCYTRTIEKNKKALWENHVDWSIECSMDNVRVFEKQQRF